MNVCSEYHLLIVYVYIFFISLIILKIFTIYFNNFLSCLQIYCKWIFAFLLCYYLCYFQTYTIQGDPSNSGILPRALDVIFNSISKKLYTRPNLKPKHCQEVLSLSEDEERVEESIRKVIFSAGENKEVKSFSQNSALVSQNILW